MDVKLLTRHSLLPLWLCIRTPAQGWNFDSSRETWSPRKPRWHGIRHRDRNFFFFHLGPVWTDKLWTEQMAKKEDGSPWQNSGALDFYSRRWRWLCKRVSRMSCASFYTTGCSKLQCLEAVLRERFWRAVFEPQNSKSMSLFWQYQMVLAGFFLSPTAV